MARDLDLFGKAMADVTPLKGRRPATSPTLPRSGGGNKSRDASPVKRGRTQEGVSNTANFAFDRDVHRALARGKRLPEATLDLHGMTLAAAERAVAHFLAEASAGGHRVVLIVTGKGLRLDGGRVMGGRIRAEFPGWLERADNRALVAGVRTAHLRHGGSGAFYVLLRRR